MSAAKVFSENASERMIDALPAKYQDAATMLLKAALRIAEFEGGGFVVQSELISELQDWIARLDGMCGIVE